MIKTLSDIELKVTEGAEECMVEPPSFRVDLTREVDLYEEVARLMGFDRLPVTLPAVRATVQAHNPSLMLRGEIRRILQGLGLSEIITYSFIAEDFCDKLGLPPDDRRRLTVRIINPLSTDQSLLRTTLAPGLLDVLRRNQSFNVWEVALFEIGANFFKVEGQDLPEERMFIGGLLAGPRAQLSWHQAQEPVDFYDIKGVAEDLMAGLRVSAPVFSAGECPAYYDATAAARIIVNDRVLGWVGRVSGAASKRFDLREAAGGAAYIFELDLAVVMEVRLGLPRFQSLPRFPAVERDLAVVMDREVEAARVVDYIKELDEAYLVEVVLFDAYEGRQVVDGRRSLALRLQYRAPDRTLTDEEVNARHAELTDQVLEHFSAVLRA
jgi:phenylalanyl-tRNA synthetase beta chain